MLSAAMELPQGATGGAGGEGAGVGGGGREGAPTGWGERGPQQRVARRGGRAMQADGKGDGGGGEQPKGSREGSPKLDRPKRAQSRRSMKWVWG